MKKYKKLKKQYPEYIRLDQLYKICRISKRSAVYLVKNEIIPAVTESAKKTAYNARVEQLKPEMLSMTTAKIEHSTRRHCALDFE